MSEAALFAFGSVLFILTAWSTLTFFLARFDEAYRKDLAQSPGIADVRQEGQLTETYTPTAE